MMTVERRKRVLALVDERTSITVAELSELLAVSEVTIRKILNQLDKQGLLHRTHGGAVSRAFPLPEKPERAKELENTLQKKAVALAAYDLILPGDAVFVDAGSTTMELAKLIHLGPKRDITVITNGFNIALELLDSKDIDLHFAGGKVRHEIMSCVGNFTYAHLREFCPNKAFIGTNGFTVEKGATTPDPAEAQVKIDMRLAAGEPILLTDSSKYGKYTMTRIGALADYSHIVTDRDLPEDAAERIRACGVGLILADY